MGRPRIWRSDAERMAAGRSGGRTVEARAAAVEVGRLLGEETATQLREDEHQREQRVARAMAYAAWEFDGKPPDSWDRYRGEFGVVTSSPVMMSLDRPAAKA